MPKSPVRGCAYGRCSKRAVPGSQYCEEHKKLMDRQYNRYTREEGVKKKYGTAYRSSGFANPKSRRYVLNIVVA
jgi:5-methylcytosine-specific restriction protein A